MADPTEIKGVVVELEAWAAGLEQSGEIAARSPSREGASPRVAGLASRAGVLRQAATLLAQEHEARVGAEEEAHELTKALTGLTCGGSEFFIRKGSRYLADIAACVDWVRRRDTDAHRRVVDAIKAQQAAELRSLSAEGLVAELVEGLRPFGERAENIVGAWRDTDIFFDGRFKVGDFRKAQALLLKAQQFQAVSSSEGGDVSASSTESGRGDPKPSPTAALEALEALKLALPILDDDLAGYQNDAPPRAYDARGFVCLDDLSCNHDRWKECEATLKALAAIRDLLPPAEWADNVYAENQLAVEHFSPSTALSSEASPLGEELGATGIDGGREDVESPPQHPALKQGDGRG